MSHVRAFRGLHRLHQWQLAKMLGVTARTVQMWEAKDSPPAMVELACAELARRMQSGDVIVPVNAKRGRPRKEPQG